MFGILVTCILLLTLLLNTYFKDCKPLADRKKHYILLYTPFFGEKQWINYLEGTVSHPTAPKRGQLCSTGYCESTYNKSLFSTARAVVFHARDMPDLAELEVLHAVRPAFQLWCYFNMENPLYSRDTSLISKFFNVTMSCNQESEMFLPYASFEKLEPNDIRPLPNTNFAKGKTKMAAWVVSNCDISHRNQLVKLLQEEGIKVSVAGKCSEDWGWESTFNCKGHGSNNNFVKELRHFKFYLALENAICQDYITQKYYLNSLKNNLIPIVLGGAVYSDPRLALPGSYINVQDYASIEQLANHIKAVASNEALYNSYFRWRYEYKITLYNWFEHFADQLCSFIWEGTRLHTNISAIYSRNKCFEKDRQYLLIPE